MNPNEIFSSMGLAAKRLEMGLTSILKESEIPNEFRTLRRFTKSDATELLGISDDAWRNYLKNADVSSNPEAGHRDAYTRPTLSLIHRAMDDLSLRPKVRGDKANVIGIVNFKGGSSKTQSTIHLAQACAILGYRTLVIDTDQQATASRFFGVNPRNVELKDTIGCYLESATGLVPDDFKPQATYISGLSLVPASLALFTLNESIGVQGDYRAGEFAEARNGLESVIDKVASDYDLVFIDYQPSFSFLQALITSLVNTILVPTPTESSDLAGTLEFLTLFLEAMVGLKDILEPRGKSLRLDTVRFFKARVRKSNGHLSNLIDFSFEKFLMNSEIDDMAALTAAGAFLFSVFEADRTIYDMRSLKKARSQYMRLARELIDIVSQDKKMEIIR